MTSHPLPWTSLTWTNSLGEELSGEDSYSRVTTSLCKTFICFQSQDLGIHFSLQERYITRNKEHLGPYFKEEKVNCGYSAPYTTTFLISKLKVIEHGITDKKIIKLPIALKKAHILGGQEDIYSNNYSIL